MIDSSPSQEANIVLKFIFAIGDFLPLIPWFMLLAFAGANLFSGAFLATIVLFLSYVVGLFVNAQLLLPLIYGVPLSIWFVFRKRVTVMAIFTHLITPTLWFLMLFTLGFILAWFDPRIVIFLTDNSSVSTGGSLAVLSLLLNFFSPKGLKDMWEDYDRNTLQKYRKS